MAEHFELQLRPADCDVLQAAGESPDQFSMQVGPKTGISYAVFLPTPTPSLIAIDYF
jgi:hypothetical protein